MILREWKSIPEFMKCDEVKEYYDILSQKKMQLIIKRIFDVVVSLILFVLLIIPLALIAILIVLDSPGGVFFRQERVTAYGKVFKIHKFRTMIDKAPMIGESVTVENDSRITRVGSKLRDLRLDELPQLLDVIFGNMTIVGTRAEVPKYVEKYTDEMKATLLLPAGITSEASIQFKDEAKLLAGSKDVDREYEEKILPQKMKFNLESLRNFDLRSDIKVMIKTVKAVIR